MNRRSKQEKVVDDDAFRIVETAMQVAMKEKAVDPRQK